MLKNQPVESQMTANRYSIEHIIRYFHTSRLLKRQFFKCITIQLNSKEWSCLGLRPVVDTLKFVLPTPMSATVFHFKQFTVHQDRCAMKVGTDGVLIGAWSEVPSEGKILDIGTGTGLIALMLAQRSAAFIDAIDIDAGAFGQALDNVQLSPWSDRIRVIHAALHTYRPVFRYDLIVSNPPYFIDSVAASDEARTLARSATASLRYEDLIQGVVRLLKDSGRFCVILPFKEGQLFRDKAEQNGLFCNKQCYVKTGREKPYKRVMMEFSRREALSVEDELVIHYDAREFTPAYKLLTADFYPAF